MSAQQRAVDVHGVVTGTHGKPVQGARVVVYWQQLRERTELAQGHTGEHGAYHLELTPPAHAPQPLLLVVEAQSPDLPEPLRSPLTEVQPTLEINLHAEPVDASQWTRLVHAIQPWLDGVHLHDLVENRSHEDITFLARELRSNTETVMQVAVAARLEAAFKVPAAAFYAFLAQRTPRNLPSPLLDASQEFTLIDPLVHTIASRIFALSAEMQTKTLTAAVALDIIGPHYTQRIDELVRELQKLRTTDLLSQPFLTGRAPLTQLLDVAGLPAAKQQAFAQALATNQQPMGQFWRTLGDGKHGLTAAEAASVQRVLSIGALVRNHLPLVQKLDQGFASGTYATLASLATLSLKDWTTLVGQSGVPPNVSPSQGATPSQVFASQIYTAITRAYPTAAMGSRIAGSAYIPAAVQRPLALFFQNNSRLELVKDNLTVYLEKQGDKAFTGISPELKPQVVSSARKVQRVLRLAPAPDTAEKVLTAGYGSATQIAALGQQQFIGKAIAAGLTAAEANKVYQVSADRYAQAVALYMEFNSKTWSALPQSVGGQDTTPASLQDTVARDDSLSTLFGSQDFCAVDGCTSVLSPAAYLCDLLLWLRNHPQGSGTALDVLDSRRPDIRHLLLNCPNSETELPYIDLVIELLGDAVSPLPATSLGAAINASQSSISVLSSAGFPATSTFTVLVDDELMLVTGMSGVGNTTWAVTRAQQGTTAATHGASAPIILSPPGNPPWKQTPADATPAQLSAAPAYYNQGAFNTLFNASYPQTLPYSAGLDTLRTCLQQWKLPLWQVRQALLPLTGATATQQVAVAAERLGLNAPATGNITIPNNVPAAIAWNIANPATALIPVPAFLQAASLSYEGLLDLVQSSWVQGGVGVAIYGINDLCDTSLQTISPTTPLAAAINATQTSITVQDSTEFPATPFTAVIGAEALQVTNVAGNTWTVSRAQNGTVAAAANPGAAVVVPLDSGFLDRAHRFLCLWNATGLKMWELDLLLAAPSVGNGTLDQNALIALQSFWQLQQATGLVVDRLLAFYQNVDPGTHRDPDGTTAASLYSRIFLNPTASWLAPDPDLGAVVTGGTIGNPILSDHAPTLVPALGVSAPDFALLTALTNNQLTLANLSLIYRVGALAAASGLGIANLLRFAALRTPASGVPSTTLVGAITATQSTITVANAAAFAPPSFYIQIGSEALLVTGMSGSGNATWSVLRGQLGTTAGSALNNATVTGDTGSPLSALQAALTSPAATLTFLGEAATVQQRPALSLDALTYLLTPPSAITGGWPTTSQMTPAAASSLLGAIQVAEVTLLATNPGATQADLRAAVVAAVAATARLAPDVTGLILNTLHLPASSQTLLDALMTPSLLTAAGTLTVGGAPAPGDALQAVTGNGVSTVTVSYTLVAGDAGNPTQTAADFAQAINASAAVTGSQAFLAPCTVSGAVISLNPLNPGTANSAITSTNTASPGGSGHVTISPAATQTIGLPALATQFLALSVFDKAATLVRGLRLVLSDLTWLLQYSASSGVGGLHLTQLPVTSSQPPLSFGPLLNTYLLVKLARLFTAAPPTAGVQTLYDLIGGVIGGTLATEPAIKAALATITGWSVADIEAFAASLALGVSPSFPASYESPASYDALRKLEAMSAAVGARGGLPPATGTRLTADITAAATTISVASAAGFPAPNFYVNIGTEILLVTAVSGADNLTWTVVRSQFGTTAAVAHNGDAVTATYGAQIVTWGSNPVEEPTAQSMAASALGIVKAQQPTADAWLTLAPTLVNALRERQADALQAYLVAHRDASGNLRYGDTDALFNHFLIDTRMSSCMNTSRVVQAYIAVEVFVERCRMNLEAPEVVVDLDADDTWNQWKWMSRYRLWEANREVFLYPENWLIESQRPNRSEIFQKLEREVHQAEHSTDRLETVVQSYIDRLDALSHLVVTGMCQDPASGALHVVARSVEDPPTFYLRSYEDGAWGGWRQIPLGIKAQHVVSALYRGRICLFWLEVKVANEPQQHIPPPAAGTHPPTQHVERYVSLSVNFSVFRNGSWAPPQAAKAKLFDKPWFDPSQATDSRTVESLYTIKVQSPTTSPGYGANLWVDVFRFGTYDVTAAEVAETFQMTAETLYAEAAQATGDAANIDRTVADAFMSTVTTLDAQIGSTLSQTATQTGRAIFDGRFNDVEETNADIAFFGQRQGLLAHAQSAYGPDAWPLLPLTSADPDISGEPGLLPQAGALVTLPPDPNAGPNPNLPLVFTSNNALQANAGDALLRTAPVPFRVVGSTTDLSFDPTSDFFYQDTRRCYWVESQKLYWNGQSFTPQVPSYPDVTPFETQYVFHRFYHPFTRLIGHQLASGGFDQLYDPALQLAPDSLDFVDQYPDVFSFNDTYSPALGVATFDHASVSTRLLNDIAAGATTITVTGNVWVPSSGFYVQIGSEILQVTAASGPRHTVWTVVRGALGTTATPAHAGDAVTPMPSSQDREFLEFDPGGAFSLYNWELFFHVPLYIATLLSQNQQFEDAQRWLHYIFDPTRPGADPVPQRFWITRPLNELSSGQIQQERINNFLVTVNQNDPASVAVVTAWRKNPFNPFLLADTRLGVPYMKRVVMTYLDNLIAWADNLFSSGSREALSEATLLYVIASEVLGPAPTAVPPPLHADRSYAQLEPSLDAFANAFVDIENLVGSGGGTGGSGMMPAAQTFYFEVPPNPTLLNYWSTVTNRLYKLRHCQNIAGGKMDLALFDAPIDPGLLVAAQAAGVDLSSVLADVSAALPSYRFTSLYTTAADFVNAVRAYGSSLQASLEKQDSQALTLLQQTLQQQLLNDGAEVLDWQVQQANNSIDAATQSFNLAKQKHDYYSSQDWPNAWEAVFIAEKAIMITNEAVLAVLSAAGATAHAFPNFMLGMAGFGGTPAANASEGGSNVGHSFDSAHDAGEALGKALEHAGDLSKECATYARKKDEWQESATQAQYDMASAQAQIANANLALQIAQKNKETYQEQLDNLQKQIDYVNNAFTGPSLYDWMAGSLATTYFQAYQLAYQLCKQVERCYGFELGVDDSSFINFGYWDSLYKGLLAGEVLGHALQRMNASYLQQNSRRQEISRYISLAALNPAAMRQLRITGDCDFDIPESLFDNDYPGQYNRRLVRVSLTANYPNNGPYDNVKARLTMTSNKVRVSNDISSASYQESPAGADPRFRYNWAAVPQQVTMGNMQDDPGLFLGPIATNVTDPRYMPFENAGAISSWHLEMPTINNEVDLNTNSDVIIHLYYTALDGGTDFHNAAGTYAQSQLPSSGVKMFSAQNDFNALPPTSQNLGPVTPWQAFVIAPVPGVDQELILLVAPQSFPAWTRGKTITITGMELWVISLLPGDFVVQPQNPPFTQTEIITTLVTGATTPNIRSAIVPVPGSGIPPGTWSFKVKRQGAADYQSLGRYDVSDILLFLSFNAT